MRQDTFTLVETIKHEIANDPENTQAYRDLYSVLYEEEPEDFHYAHAENKVLRGIIADGMAKSDAIRELYDLYKRSLLFDAPYDFDAYMLYLESNRMPEERFYMPRRKILKKAVDAIQDLVDDNLDELFLSMPPRVGKALANNTPILTREGWKNHGDLVVGDEVVGMDGRFKKVIAVHPKCMLDRLVEFTNGERIVCHHRHEWLLYDRARGKETLRETSYYEDRVIESRTKTGRGHRYHLQLPTVSPIEGEHKALPLDPYTFGVWLGDGSNKDTRICNALSDKAVIDKIVANGHPIRWQTVHKTTGVYYYSFDIRKELRSMGMCHSRKRTEKHIPEEYLTASLEQRLELLAGLIDTDGTISGKQIEYTTADEKLKDTFCELVSTFGWRYGVKDVEPSTSSSGIVGKHKYWVVKFTPHLVIPCALSRKRIEDFGIQRKVALKSITKTTPVEGNCITVEGGMYLAGRTMVPTHNTSLTTFLFTWILGKYPEKSNLYCAYSDTITSAFYSGVLEIMNDPYTYLWKDVFPGHKIVHTNSKEETINIDRNKKYPSLTARSLYGTLNGAVDCSGFLVSDDLIGGIEEALNPARMIGAWSKVENNMLTRGKYGAKLLWVGTRWSIIDPAGKRLDMLENDQRFEGRRYRVVTLPALNENDESNFDYDYGVGFTTEYFLQRRASFERNGDLASWNAQYMQTPIERDGTVFVPDMMRMYSGSLPDNPTGIVMSVDPAFGGGDYVAAPIAATYDDGDAYIIDTVFNNGDKRVTIPILVDRVLKHGVRRVQFYSNKMTNSYREEFEKELRATAPTARVLVTAKPDSNKGSKQQRIFDAAPDIRERFVFLEPRMRTKEYELFMQNVYSFTFLGKNPHDDAPDSLTQLLDMVVNPMGSYRIFKRTF